MPKHDTTKVLAALRTELEELDARIAADTKKRRRLAAAVSALEGLDGPRKRAVPIKAAPPEKSSAATSVIDEPAKPGKMQIHEAAALILKEEAKALNATFILEQINRRGLVGRQLERTSVVSALDRKYHDGELFDKPQPGTYVLLSANGK